MPNQSRPLAPLHMFPSILQDHIRAYIALPAEHPAKIGSRTYGLCLLLSLGPALLPFVAKAVGLAKAGKDVDRAEARKVVAGLKRLLGRELGPFGFAFAITTAVSGGSFLQSIVGNLESSRSLVAASGGLGSVFHHTKFRLRCCWKSLSNFQQTYLINALASAVAIALLQGKPAPGRPEGVPGLPSTLPIPIGGTSRRQGISPTLNLTLVLFVRALDSVVRGGLQDKLLQNLGREGRKVTFTPAQVEKPASIDSTHAKNWIDRRTSTLDSLVFCICSARIIWCFFYKPEKLPRGYVKWISRLAEIDPRIIWALQSVRSGTLSYERRHAASPRLIEFAKDLGYPASWGDLNIIPAYGTDATPIWRKLGVEGRDEIGGIPCELVHGGNGAGNSCRKNIGIRGRKAWLSALMIYLPAHLLPSLIMRPRDMLSPKKLMTILLGVIRSATFLSAFVQLMWLGVCSTRTFLFARLFPWISHDNFDGPFGCIFVASLLCGSSVWIENPRKRGEIALYALPRAIRTILSDSCLKSGRLGGKVQLIERIVFVGSLSTLLTSGIHRPESLRGLSRWTINYVLKGSSSLEKKKL
ncbi:hypothetical protein BJ322DRAFT_746067 [Thelephora terrestris]|uniref:Transmembrane protein 135 N-terminal domain-containing protein n=1 Tax=Thelephora terrestris TaxID=56493 RepID=A0A9P6HH21_9AGAM|nr:hypothetical protein BJ322DRAFT_746067 [Thelephora terrestris]